MLQYDTWYSYTPLQYHVLYTLSGRGVTKIVPGLCELDQKRPYVVCMKLFEMNGLSWLIKEINRLMLDVLT